MVKALLVIYLGLWPLWFGYCLAAFLAGSILLRSMLGRPWLQANSIVLVGSAITMGHGVLGLVWQSVAALGLFNLTAVVAVLGVMSAGGLYLLWREAEPFLSGFRQTFSRWRQPMHYWLVAGATVLLVLMFLPLTLVPPGTDATAFYISQPKLIASIGKIVPLAGYEHFSFIGIGSEMHYAAFLKLGGDFIGEHAGRMFIWTVAASSGAIIWGIGEKAGLTPVCRWLLVLALFASSSFTLVLWDGKTDLLPSSLGLLAIYYILSLDQGERGLRAAGLAAGLAVIGKLTFVPSLGMTIAVLLVWRTVALNGSVRIFQPTVRSFVMVGLWTLPPIIALVLKNAAVFGEPLAPFIMLKESGDNILDQIWFNPENTRWIVMTYPLALTLGQYPMQHGNLSPLLLAMAPVLLIPALWRQVPKVQMWLFIAGIAGVVAWVVLRPSVLAPRYILPSLLACLPIAIYLLHWLWRSNYLVARAIVALVVAVTFFLPFTETRAQIKTNLHSILWMPRKIEHPIWQAAGIPNEVAPRGARVANFMYYSSMYRSDLLACLVVFTPKQMKAIAVNPDRFWEEVYTRGATFVVYDKLTHEKQLTFSPDMAHAPGWLEIREFKINDRFRTYQLIPGAGAPAVTNGCSYGAADTLSLTKN